MKAKTSNKTHGLFYSLMKQVPGYNAEYRDVIKEGLVGAASKGKTCSLTELWEKWPADYHRMIEEMKIATRTSPPTPLPRERGIDRPTGEKKADAKDKWRKRCIAAVCGWLDARNVHFATREEKVGYAIGCICRAGSASELNAISEARLKDVYNEFKRKTAVVVAARPETDFIISEN